MLGQRHRLNHAERLGWFQHAGKPRRIPRITMGMLDLCGQKKRTTHLPFRLPWQAVRSPRSRLRSGCFKPRLAWRAPFGLSLPQPAAP